jgi:hypothetical protein
VGGRVRLYTAQSPKFLNAVNGNTGVTKDLPAYDGQGASAAHAFQGLPDPDQQSLLAFLGCI